MIEIFVGVFVLFIVEIFNKKPERHKDLDHIVPILDILDEDTDNDADHIDLIEFEADNYDSFDEFQ